MASRLRHTSPLPCRVRAHTSGERLAQRKEVSKTALGMEQQPKGQSCYWDDQGALHLGWGGYLGEALGTSVSLPSSGDRCICLPHGQTALVRPYE